MKITLRDVEKGYGFTTVLDRISLEIEPGQLIVILGSNGAGKTTLLRCLSGIAVPNKGEILFDDQIFRRDRLDLRRRFYFLPDFPFFLWEHSLIHNISIIIGLYEADERPGMKERVVELLRAFDLLGLAQRPVRNLSRGQIYKAGLVALLATDPEVWLLDEPLSSGMDAQGIQLFQKHCREAATRGRTILYTTQILDIAERFSDRVCLLHKGKVKAFDSVAKLRLQADNKDQVLLELFKQMGDVKN
jgi:ABC-2 type transport system ATP-binding protein